LGSGNIAVSVDGDIDGVDRSGVHGGEVGVVGEDDFAVAGMQVEVFLHGFLGLADVDGENDEVLAGEFAANPLDKGRFFSAEATPSGPEFEKGYFALDGVVGEFFAGRGRGGKARSGLLVFGSGHEAERGEEQGAGECATEEDGSRSHSGNVA